MTMRNVEANKEVVEQAETDVRLGRETAGGANTAPSTPEQPEGVEKEFSVQQEQSSGEQTDDKGNTGVDSGIQEATTGKEGGGTVDWTVNDNDQELDEPKEITEKRNRIAKDVFEKNDQCKALYFTADLIPFFEKSDALRHGANSLGNDTVVTINRE